MIEFTADVKRRVQELLGSREYTVVEPSKLKDHVLDTAKQIESKRIDVAGGIWLIHLFQFGKDMFVQVQDPDKQLAYALPLAKEPLSRQTTFKKFLEMMQPITPDAWFKAALDHAD